MDVSGQETRLPFRAEMRRENWYPDGRRADHSISVTRLPDGSFLAVHMNDHFLDPPDLKGTFYFYLHDLKTLVEFGGQSELGAAWPIYLGPDARTQGQNPSVQQYGDCSMLRDVAVPRAEAGEVLGYRVVRVESQEKNEVETKWIAPELGCFPLRSQVLVDGLVRERIDTLHLHLLPPGHQLRMPKGIQVVSPQRFFDLYKKRYGKEYLPERLRLKFQAEYEKAKAEGRE